MWVGIRGRGVCYLDCVGVYKGQRCVLFRLCGWGIMGRGVCYLDCVGGV